MSTRCENILYFKVVPQRLQCKFIVDVILVVVVVVVVVVVDVSIVAITVAVAHLVFLFCCYRY